MKKDELYSLDDSRMILASNLKKGDVILDERNKPYRITTIDYEDTYVQFYADNLTENGNARFTFDNDEKVKLRDSIKDSKYIVHFKHKNGGEDKDIIVEAKGMIEAVEIAKTYVSDFYYKYVNVKPYFEDSVKDYQSTKESFERIEEMPRTARKWVGETSNKKAGLLAIENGIEDIINSADPSIREELRRRGDKILRDIKIQFRIEDEESTYTEVTKELEKNYDNFAKDSVKDSKLTLDQIVNIYKALKKNK